MTPLSQLNHADRNSFMLVCGPLFEHSAWIAQRAWPARPFRNRDALHQALCKEMYAATDTEKLELIGAHPDLVGRLAKEGRLTAESGSEQSAAGLTALSPEDAAAFDRYNDAYRLRFGFPFVICARENKKDAILAAFPVRLRNTQAQEIAAALAEIAKIARLRLFDAVSED